jgi:hypothetical protein
MKIHSTIYGRYVPQLGKIDIGGFIKTNLDWLLGAVCPEPPHQIRIGRCEEFYSPMLYFEEVKMRIGDGPEESLRNVFLIDSAMIETEIAQSQYRKDRLSTALCLWSYVFTGVRNKFRMHWLKPEDHFGFNAEKSDQDLGQDDTAVIQTLALGEMEHAIKGKPVDAKRLARTLRLKASEYTGRLDPESIIKQYRMLASHHRAKAN